MKRIRIKYTLSILIFLLAILYQSLGIEIQDNFVELIKWVTLGMLGGFGVKEVMKKWVQ